MVGKIERPVGVPVTASDESGPLELAGLGAGLAAVVVGAVVVGLAAVVVVVLPGGLGPNRGDVAAPLR